jgi:AcrR family transcriptional regulator
MAPSDVKKPAAGAARERILDTAYELFSRRGTRAVGVDTIIAESGVAKMTLYRNFASKDALILEFLRRREELWTRAWLQGEAEARAETPAGRILAIFDVFGEWFARDDFEGCAFINVMLELDDRESAVRVACVQHLAAIRGFVGELLVSAGLSEDDAAHVAAQVHMLMKGSIVAAGEGDVQAAARAREVCELVLAHRGVL